MDNYEVYQKIKYGDIIYIEFTYEKSRQRNILNGGQFTIKDETDVKIRELNLSKKLIYLKDFEENLFIIFPKMKEEFMNRKSFVKKSLASLKEKKSTSKSLSNDNEYKNNITKVIKAFQETIENVYSENEKFMQEIGKPIYYEDDFILIHFKTHCFVKRNENITNKSSALILSPDYTDECIFFFNQSSQFNLNLKNVFSNQNVFICKREKNIWSNNNFLNVKKVSTDKNKTDASNLINTNNTQGRNYNESDNNDYIMKNNNRFILDFNEGQGQIFQIKICSSYIDPSSSNLSFATPVWLTVQSIDRYLNITMLPKNEDLNYERNSRNLTTEKKDNFNSHNGINNYNSNSIINNSSAVGELDKAKLYLTNSSKYSKRQSVSHKPLNNYKISFVSNDKEKSINNINGLFFIEQYEDESFIDENLKELKMPSYVEFHKRVRFRHVISKKYLGFQENINEDMKTNINQNNTKADNYNKREIKGKTFGKLILLDVPSDDCNWMLMESYKVLESEKYMETKIIGVEKGDHGNEESSKEESEESQDSEDKKNESEKSDEYQNESNESKSVETNEVLHKIKNNEILRIFHMKTQKFLSFDEVFNKNGEKNKLKTLIVEDLYTPKIDKQIDVHNLALTKIPYDSDLVRLVPSDANQSLEISILLYFKKQLNEQIDYLIKKDLEKIFRMDTETLRATIEVRTSNNIRNNIGSITVENNTQNDNINNINTHRSLKINRKSINNNNNIFKNINKKSKKFIESELQSIIDQTKRLIKTYGYIKDYTLNQFPRKYETNISDGKALFYRQQFLYDQGILKKSFKYLEYTKRFDKMYKKHNEYIKKKYKEEEEVEKIIGKSVQKCFEFISSMCKNNPNNKKFAFKNKELFLYYFLEYEEASDCFIDLLKENENIMNLINNQQYKNKENADESEEGEENIIDKILKYLNDSENYEKKNLKLLSNFLVINDSGITSNQQYIFEKLFYKGEDNFLIKIKPLYNDIEFKIVYKDENKNYIENNLIEFCNNQHLLERGIIEYLAEQLNLYAYLCYGRNYVCIEKIRKIFPMDHLIFHISKVDLNQEILAGLINILNYAYIDIEPHIMNDYPSLIKRVTNKLRIERISKEKIKTYIPLNKLNLILCISLFLLNNIKYGTVLVNNANINMIYNIIKFHLYENVVYSPLNISEVINNNLDQRLHNLKDEVKENIIYGEELLINKKQEKNIMKKEIAKKNNEIIDEISDLISKNEEEHKLINESTNDEKNKNGFIGNTNSFYNKYGYKYIDFNFESPIGEEYLLFVLDRINDFFLNSLILANIDNNTEDKNIISQNFKSLSSNDILTQSNINYLMKTLIEIKEILTQENNIDETYAEIMKQIEKVISFILDIKTEDMSIYLLENILKINYQLIDITLKDEKIMKKYNEQDIFHIIKDNFYDLPNIRDILMDDEFYYYQLFNKINYYDKIPKLFPIYDNSNDNKILNALLKTDKTPEQNKRLLNNSLFSEETSLLDMNYDKYKDFQNLPNNYFSTNANYSNEVYQDSEYYYNLNMPKLKVNFDNFFMNSVIFKNLIELITRILEMNVNSNMTEILLRIFKRLISQRSELFSCINNVLLLYKENDLQKYYICNLSIKELSLLAEKTEKWMTEDFVPIKFKTMVHPEDINIDEIEDDKKDFYMVYSTIYKYLSMIIDFESKYYYEEEEVKLIQKIFYSFQMENILSSLIKEIIQEYPMDDNNIINANSLKKTLSNLTHKTNSKYLAKAYPEEQKKKKKKYNEITTQKEKELIYKIALEKLIKIIFKLFLALIHNTAPNLNETIIEVVDFSKEYKYLLNFGLLQLIVELSSDEKFVLLHSKYLIDLINKQLCKDYIGEISNHFFDYHSFDFPTSLKKRTCLFYSLKNFQKAIKKYSFLLKLMKNVITKVNDEKYIGRLLEKFVEIINVFNYFTLNNIQNLTLNESKIGNIRKSIMPIKSTKSLFTTNSKNNKFYNMDFTSKIEYYRLEFVYYLIKIAIRLTKKNQRLKQYITSLISIKKLIDFIFELTPPFTEEQIKQIIESKKYKKSKIFEKIEIYFKVKCIGCIFIFSLSKNSKKERKYIAQYIDNYYSSLNEDLDYAILFRNEIENKEKFVKKLRNYIKVYEKYRRHMYKYFFKSIYYYLSIINEKSFKNYGNIQRAKSQFDKINNWKKLLIDLNNEKDKLQFQKIFTYIEHKKKELQNIFDYTGLTFNTSKNETRTLKYIKLLKQGLVGPEENKLTTLLNDPNRQGQIIFEITINFVNDLISDINNSEVIEKCIKREKKIMARNLKTKINFHDILKKYIENGSQQDLEIFTGHETEIHLVNIFLKFIQENADNKKYFPVIKELIELMVYLVSVTPEIIKREKKVEKNNLNYFDQKVVEFKELFFCQCQKSYLNNGAIETFLKIASQRGKYFHQNTFNMIIYLFKTILDGGNTDIQKKFIHLFQLLPNIDNFFMSIYQSFNKDIFTTLNSDPFIEETKIDNQNLEMVTDKLRFLQLLTENHNLFLQNYLREQTNNRISYNFLNILIEYLSMLLTKLENLKDKYNNLTPYYTRLYYRRLLYLLDTICEFLQGPCKQNQEYLINTKVIELFNKIMEETYVINNDEVDEKKLEGNNDQNTVVCLPKRNISNSFGAEILINNRRPETDEDLYYKNNLQQDELIAEMASIYDKNEDSSSPKNNNDNNNQQTKIFTPLSDYEKSMLLFKISLVLLSFIEGRKSKDSVIRKVLRDINYKLVFEICGEIYKKLKNEMIFFLFTEDNTKDIEFLDDKVVSEAGFNLYFLMKILVSMENEETELKINSSLILETENKYDRIYKEKQQEIFRNSEVIQKAMEFYSENSLDIEILKDNEVFKVYCPRLHFFNAFDEKMKKDFDDNADRESAQSKLTYLLNKKEQIYMNLKQVNVLEEKYGKFGPLRYLLIYQNLVKTVGFLLVILMNILLFIGYNAEKDRDQKNVIHNVKIFKLSEASSTALLHILGVIILVFDIIIVLEFITKDAVLIYKNLHDQFLKKSYENKTSYISDMEIHRVYSFLKSSGYSLYCNKIGIFIKLFFNPHVLYTICFMLFAFLGLFVHHFFFSFHLIELIKSQPILKYVFLAFYEPLTDVVFTYIFFFILIYFYSLLIFYRYYDLMPDNTCDSPLICMLYIYSNTFTSGGNLGNFIDEKQESINLSGDMERYLLDISYTVIMVYVVWQMVSGLILDAFDDLRGDREEIEEDMETTCFICGLKREKIEKYYIGKEGFEKHLQDHSVENYLFYMFYLEEKDPNEYSGLESYVKENIDKESIKWFPMERSLKIEEWESKHKS